MSRFQLHGRRGVILLLSWPYLIIGGGPSEVLPVSGNPGGRGSYDPVLCPCAWRILYQQSSIWSLRSTCCTFLAMPAVISCIFDTYNTFVLHMLVIYTKQQPIWTWQQFVLFHPTYMLFLARNMCCYVFTTFQVLLYLMNGQIVMTQTYVQHKKSYLYIDITMYSAL